MIRRKTYIGILLFLLSNGLLQAQVIDSFPYLNTFENGTLNRWDAVDVDTDGVSWTSTYLFLEGVGNRGSQGFASSASYDNTLSRPLTPDNYLISPRIAIPAGSAMELQWFVAAQDPQFPAEHYAVYVATDSTINAFTEPLFEETLSSTTFVPHTLSLASFAGQEIFIAFRHYGCTNQFVLKLDDIRIGNPVAPEIALSVPPQVIAGETVTLRASATGSVVGTTYNWTLTGAQPATAQGEEVEVVWNEAGDYLVQCVAHNNYGADTATATLSVVACNVVSEFPFMENFETPSSCLLMLDADGDGNGWQIDYPHPTEYGNHVARSASYRAETGTLQPDNWLVLNPLSIPEEGDVELRWKVAAEMLLYPSEHYGVYLSTGGRETADFTHLLFEETLSQGEVWNKRALSLSQYAGEEVFIAIRHWNCENQSALLIDQIEVGTPAAPEGSWNLPETGKAGEELQIVVEALSSVPVTYQWNVEDMDLSSYTTNILNITFPEEGVYSVSVELTSAYGTYRLEDSITILDCAEGWITPVAETFDEGMGCWTSLDWDGDGSGWEPLAERLAELGNNEYLSGLSVNGNAMVSWSYEPVMQDNQSVEWVVRQSDNLLLSPEITIPQSGNWVLTLGAFSIGGDDNPDTMSVWVSTNGIASSEDDYDEILPQQAVRNGSLQNYQVSLDSYRGQSVRVAIRHKSSDQLGLVVDELTISEGTVSVDPTPTVQIKVYPNPTKDLVNIEAPEVNGVELFDLSGKRLLAANHASSLDISPLPAGTYILKISTAKGLSVQKIVKR